MLNLCNLEIKSCRSLRTIPYGLRFVTTLRELEIKEMQKTFKDRVDKVERIYAKSNMCLSYF
jgi:hypothetical protein